MRKLAIDDEVLDEVAVLAKARGVSSERLAGELLRDALRREKSKPTIREVMEQIAALTPASVEQTDAVELLREERGE